MKNIRALLKIAFFAKTNEIMPDKAVRQNGHRRSSVTARTCFASPTKYDAIHAVCSGNKFLKAPISFVGVLFVCFLLVFFGFAGCEKDILKEAFKGEYTVGKGNNIINEYCTSCHVHSKFVPDPHIDAMNRLYRHRLFRTTNECRVCHYLDDNILGDVLRKHRRPRAVDRGRFKKFIHEEKERRAEKRRGAD